MDKKSKFKLLIGNFVVYGVGGTISSAIPIIMIPIITRLMPNSSYVGINDMANSLVAFGNAFALMGMYDSMYRMFFEYDDDIQKKEICSTALAFTLCTSFVVAGILVSLENCIAKYMFAGENNYIVYLCAMTVLVSSTNSIVSAPIRMQNRRKIYLALNILSPIISYSISIPLIFKGCYVIALPLATFISGFIIECSFYFINKNWFSKKYVNWRYLPILLKLSLPQLPNLLIYWVFNACDRLMILNMMGMQEAGVYGIAAKFGHISQLIYTAFVGGWQYFAFSVMREKDQVKTNSYIFEFLGIITFVATGVMCLGSNWLFVLLFPEEYITGSVTVPYLFISPLLLMLFQVIAYQFLIILKTWPNMLLLSVGAIINILCNYVLIPRVGIEGAAIATMLGYVTIVVLCAIVLYKMKLFVVKKRFLIASVLFFVYFVMWRLYGNNKIVVSWVALGMYSLILVVMYKNDIVSLMNLLKNRDN